MTTEPPDPSAGSSPPEENRLAGETSPYLRQHRHNPVDWYPWGENARRKALDEDRPILLSIGYSACHWCHVMERESFDDPDTARLMNEGFVNIKVDREERPDVDSVYMRAVQALTGRGGWPLTVFLTPEGEPFYGGTYFPPEPRQGMPSFPQVLAATRSAWMDRREDVRSAAAEIREILDRSTRGASTRGPSERPDGGGMLTPRLVEGAVQTLLRHLDSVQGGFGRAPKFPQPLVLDFLLERHAVTGDPAPLEAAMLTLRKMARGGIRDQLGGGFHRYAVDARWLVPHFEKMLYDNALLARAYLHAFQLTGDPEMERICREVVDDVLGDFRSPEGGFYTARDADSEGEEGLFYVWTPEEVRAELAGEDARLFCTVYDVTEAGNFEGRSILHLPRGLDEIAEEEELSRDELETSLARSCRTLADARARREPPLRDEKILAAWNGFMLRTLAEAGAALDETRYLSFAERGMDWLLGVLRTEGGLRHQVTVGRPGVPAFLDDVASLGNAALSLYEATLEPRWLAEAVALDRKAEEEFRDPESGLLYDTSSAAERLVVRPREVSDSPIPSGTSLAAELRLRLGRLTGDADRIDAARKLVAAEASSVERTPGGFGRLLSVAARLLEPSMEVAIVGPAAAPGTRALLRAAHRSFVPGRVVGGGADDGAETAAESISPLLEGRSMLDGKPTAFVCHDFACNAPTTDPDALARQMDTRSPTAR